MITEIQQHSQRKYALHNFADVVYTQKFLQVCEADRVDELTTSLDLLTADLVLLTSISDNSTMACPEDLMNIVLLLEFIVK